jgi:exonuclease VII small subunit
MSVQREKYVALKHKLESWIVAYNETESELEHTRQTLEDAQESLGESRQALEEAQDSKRELEKELEEAQSEIEKYIERLSIIEQKYELKYKRIFREKESTLLNQIASLQRDLILRDGRIQQLEESKKDLADRYKELREDSKAQRVRE